MLEKEGERDGRGKAKRGIPWRAREREEERDGEMFSAQFSFLTKRQGEDAKGTVLEGHLCAFGICVFCFLLSLKGGDGGGDGR